MSPNTTCIWPQLWAKWGNDGESRYPLIAHLIDTAAASRALLVHWYPRSAQQRLADLLQVDLDGLADLVSSAAALHDLGKATPVFQGQLFSARRDQFASHMSDLAAAGLTIPSDLPRQAPADVRTELVRHEIASAVALTGDYPDAGSRDLAAVVNGHHGRWHIPAADGAGPDAEDYHLDQLEHPGWSQARDSLLSTLSDVCGTDPDLRVSDPSLIPILTGLVCLADWIASDHATRTATPNADADWRELYNERAETFSRRIPDLLGRPNPPDGDFPAVFHFPADRPVQQQMLAHDACGLSVVMAPTGDGKTEAALGHWLAHRSDREGLYFALPTMATADAMFSRVSALFAQSDKTTPGALLHGRAVLNAFYEPARADLAGEVHDHDHTGGLEPGDWFTGRHRPMLAPVAVGTVDQLLSGALRHRFNFMRLLAAAGKTLVLDEVHSYDPYMAMLTERLLHWAGHLGVRVILLSATLPAERLHAYVRAYSGRALDSPARYPSVVHAPPSSTPDAPAPEAVELDASHRSRDIRITYARGSSLDTTLAETVLRARQEHPDAKIGVIVSTVGRCQQLARACADLDPAVMHSRFPSGVRADQLDEAEQAFGKHAAPGPGLLLATQVIEQSVDLDFDLLITDLAPASSLLQRLGRLWRHDRGPDAARPDTIDGPTCAVVAADPLAFDDLYAFLPYSTAEIAATWRHALQDGARHSIRIPDDVQAMTDAAHVTLADLPNSGDDKVVDSHVTESAHVRLTGAGRAIPTPGELRSDPAYRLEQFSSGQLHDEGETRWSTLDRATLLLVGSADGAWSGPLPTKPDRQQLRDLLAATVSVSGAVAARARAIADSQTHLTVEIDHRLLADVIVVDLDACDEIDLDPLVGLTA